MQAFKGVEVQLPTHTHSTTVNGHEWAAPCQATPMPSEQEAGLGTRTGTGILE